MKSNGKLVSLEVPELSRLDGSHTISENNAGLVCIAPRTLKLLCAHSAPEFPPAKEAEVAAEVAAKEAKASAKAAEAAAEEAKEAAAEKTQATAEEMA